MSHEVYAKSSDRPFLKRECRINVGLDCGVKRYAAIDDGKLQPHIVGNSLYGNITTSALWIGIVHYVDHSLLKGEIHLHGFCCAESSGFAHSVNEGCQPRHLLRVVCQNDTLAQEHIMLLLDVLYSHHCQVVALFGIAHELVNGLCHHFDYLLWRLLLAGESLRSDLIDALHSELCMIDILGLCQTVCKEEYGGACENLSLLQRIFPRAHYTYWDI